MSFLGGTKRELGKIDYHYVVDAFINEKLLPRINSGAYDGQVLEVLKRIEWELRELVAVQRGDNLRKAGGWDETYGKRNYEPGVGD